MSKIDRCGNDNLDGLRIIPKAMTDDERLIRVVIKTIANERKETKL